MGKRVFNKRAYDLYDMSAKKRLIELIENTSDYRLIGDINDEHYKICDVGFKNNNNIVLFENEVRGKFDFIIQNFEFFHIPIRKKNTMADFYLIWSPDLYQFILITREIILKNINNIINIDCNKEMDESIQYNEDFIEIPKNETTWYVIGKNYELFKLNY